MYSELNTADEKGAVTLNENSKPVAEAPAIPAQFVCDD